ncbi:hypothetical protein AAZX31_01G050000 [Glycine max]
MKHKIPRIAINANQVVNKMKRWSTKPNDVVDMMNTSGFGWDDTRKCVTCDSSQKHPKVGNHVNKEFKEFEKLQSIFGKDRANGCGAEGCVDGMENEIGENQVEELFKTLTYFLYNLHPLFHLKVPEILFSNSRLFPYSEDPLLQETLSELAERRLGAGIGRHIELHCTRQSREEPSLPITRQRCSLAQRAWTMSCVVD